MLASRDIIKISFAIDKKLYYDGYLLLREDGEIVGFTDDGLIYGKADSVLIEVPFNGYEGNLHAYEIDDIFKNFELENVFSCRKVFDLKEDGDGKVAINCKKFYLSDPENNNIRISIKKIEERIIEKEKRIPKDAIEKIKRTYLT